MLAQGVSPGLNAPTMTGALKGRQTFPGQKKPSLIYSQTQWGADARR